MKQSLCKVSKDEIRRIIYIKKELKNTLLKSLLKNQQVNPNIRFWVFYKIQQNCTFISRQNNRCVVTGRSGGVWKLTNMSRHMMNKRFQFGLIPNVRTNNVK